MSRISEYMKEMLEIYGDKVELTKSTYDEKTLSLVPKALREFYAEYSKVDLPFGYIYSIENSLKDSKAEPFKSEGFFSFGFDGYFSYWLCLFTPEDDGLSFTYWDHEGGEDIGRAVYKDIIEFLEAVRSEYEENKDQWDAEDY
ncbi:hypothetical protein HBE96_07050 [Clostridium sp. P21]|uniref:Knr4/Smi1-like domain-containing protein n=1 Tax=Clostridium muellerianum TaxID=2716538 RepID=A0A7Y0EFD8_9CLOT|nr:hypothetical protein [Clostridium muellerianum]NMM62450.1 hypothetical protein [Clostridium muellerianum]